MSEKFKADKILGSIRLFRQESGFRLLRQNEDLLSGDIIELLSPLSEISIKGSEQKHKYSGICRLQIDKNTIIKLADKNENSIDLKFANDKLEATNEKPVELVEEIEFKVYNYLRQNLSALDIYHIVDQKVLIFDVPKYLKFYKDEKYLEPDVGCLILNITDTLWIKKYKEQSNFLMSIYIFHQAQISKYTSFPKGYTNLGTNENGLTQISKDLSLEFHVKI